MAFDYKKEYRCFYLPPATPEIVEVPPMLYAAVRGQGDPNAPDGAYQRAIGTLYAVTFTLKMSGRAGHTIDGFFDYVAPPLEGFWWQEGVDGIDYAHKDAFNWLAAIRLPEFVTREAFDWAVDTASEKKKADLSDAEYLEIDEGLCVQMLHVGPYDDEPASVAAMTAYLGKMGYADDFSDTRRHHEIYLNDARRTAPQRLKTVLRHPVRRL